VTTFPNIHTDSNIITRYVIDKMENNANNIKLCVLLTLDISFITYESAILYYYIVLQIFNLLSKDDNSSEIPGVYIGVIVGVSAIVIIILVIMILYCIYACTIGRKA